MSNDTRKHREETSELSDPLQLFNNFYRQIVLVKQSMEKNNLELEVSQFLQINRQPTMEEIAETVSSRLQHWIEKKRKAAKKVLTEKEYTRIHEALFVCAALADELFLLEIDWVGQDYWPNVLLEERLFESSYAGERFFIGVVGLLNDRIADPQQRSLMAVYFLAMRLGFEGRYRGQKPRLEHIRKQLFKRIYTGLDSDASLVCPQAYEHSLASAQEKRLAPLIRWKKAMIQWSVGYLLISWVVWVTFKGVWAAS